MTGLVGRAFSGPGEWVPVAIVLQGVDIQTLLVRLPAAVANGAGEHDRHAQHHAGRYAPNANQPFTGNIDRLQIDKGVALYDYSYNPATGQH